MTTTRPELAPGARFSQALSTDDRQRLEGYLAWKWGTQASLAAGHPYLSAAPLTTSP